MDSQSQCHAKFWYFWVNFGTFSGFYWHFGIYLSNPPSAQQNETNQYCMVAAMLHHLIVYFGPLVSSI